jgi:hypothetical protein
MDSKAQPARKADNITAICEQTVQTMLDPQHLTTVQVSTTCYGDGFTILLFTLIRTQQNVHYTGLDLCVSGTVTLLRLDSDMANLTAAACN